MGDGYPARFPPRLRVLFVAASVLVSLPVLTLAPAAIGSVAVPPGVGLSLAAVLIAVQAAAVWWLAARPLPGTAVVLLVSAGLQILYPAFGPGIAFVALCTCAWLRPATQTLRVLALAVPAVCGPAVARGRGDLAALWLGAVLLAWSWGALARARGARRLAERRQAVLEERARIARELHDVLSHTVTVMVVQAAAADDVFDTHPERAREALRRTEQAGRQALTELRGFLRVVRADSPDDLHPGLPPHAGPGDGRGDGAGPDSPPRNEFSDGLGGSSPPWMDPAGEIEPRMDPAGEMGAPQPTLADVERLAATMGEIGLPVTVHREGSAEIPWGVQLSAYRIVQEALTNTLRHARASRAEILLRIGEAEVYVRIRDDGTGGTPGHRAGQGLLGMRERAGLLGGTLGAGPRPGGGFEVAARLPLREPA